MNAWFQPPIGEYRGGIIGLCVVRMRRRLCDRSRRASWVGSQSLLVLLALLVMFQLFCGPGRKQSTLLEPSSPLARGLVQQE